MNLKTRLGLWLFNLGLRLMRKGMTMAGIAELPSPTNDTLEGPTPDIYIHHVLEGPFTRYDFEDMDDWTGPNETEAFLLVKISQGDVVSDVEWYFHSVEEAFLWVRHFKGSIEPIVINGDTYG